jgi:Tol biopolymer transport system component
MKVFVSYKRDHLESETLLSLLETEVPSVYGRVYSDRLLTAGEWRPKLLEWIDGCDVFIVLLSEKAVESEEVREEVHRAYDRWVISGRKNPTIIPVGVDYSGPLSGFRRDLSGFQGLRWRGEEDNETLLTKIRREVTSRWRPRVYMAAIAVLLVVAFVVSYLLLSSRDGLGTFGATSPVTEPAVTPRNLSVRRITDVGNVASVAVSPDAKTVFINRFGFIAGGVHVTDVHGATPRKLFDAFGGTIACGKSHCYLSGALNDRPGLYRFSASEPPLMLFTEMFSSIDVSPAGDRLLLTRYDGQTQNYDLAIRRIDDGSQTIERSSHTPLLEASWHPDGRSILYVDALKDAVVHELASGKRSSLPRAALSIFGAAWEARGKYVLAYTLTATAGEFWILRPGAQPIGPILRDTVRYDNIRATSLPDTFSALRRETSSLPRLAFLGRPSDERAIGQLNAGGPFSWTEPERMLYAAKDDSGTWIAEYDIYSQQVRRLSPTGWIGRPALTPDGARLVFTKAAEGEYGLWTSPAARWDPIKLVEIPTLAHAISPDSKSVAFAAFGPEGGLYVTSVEPGGEVRRLTRGSIWQVSFAGSRTILFRRESEGRRPLCKISRKTGSESCFAVDGVSIFAVSPDAKTVAAATLTEKGTQLHFIDIASGVVAKVVTVPGRIDTNGGIAWTAGDSRIVYATQTRDETAVEAYRIADGTNEVVSNSSDTTVRHITASPDGRHVMFLRERFSSDAVLLTVTP